MRDDNESPLPLLCPEALLELIDGSANGAVQAAGIWATTGRKLP
jgi:hypothetical protein